MALLRQFPIAMLLAALLALPSVAQDEEALASPGAETGPVTERLDSIRDDLVELRFEKALAALQTLLGDRTMSLTDRTETWILLSQTHVAFGDLAAAEEDYREILAMRPAFRPSATLTPKKAMDRFEKVRKQLVGQLKIEVDPSDALLTVDGIPMHLDPEGTLSLFAGREVIIHAERDGFDSFEYPVQVEANEVRPIKLLLTPNARTVVVTTEPDGVEVFLDGASVGSTARPISSSVVTLPAELVLQNLPLGEHVFELRKECYRTEVIEESLNVDLLDRSPRRFDSVTMLAARSTLLLEDGPEGARVEADGRPLGSLPLEPTELCPGDRELVVEFGDRVLWKSVESMESGKEVKISVRSRPNTALVGVDEWPDALAGFAESFNDIGRVPVSSGADLSRLEGWNDVRLPGGTDLALAVIPSDRVGARDVWVLYSPILRVLEVLDVAPEADSRPEWERRVWGLRTVDSELGGSGRVAWLRDGGPAQTIGLSVGDRIVGVGDAEPNGAAPLREQLDAATDDAGRSRIAWIPSTGERQEGTLEAGLSPFLRSGPTPVRVAATRAAWAVVDAVRTSDRAASALANLALLFSEFGYHDLAAQTWRRVSWKERGGIGEGTADYYLGAELARLGLEEDAVAAYRRAAASASTVVDDDGPQVGPAAVDRLVDLGVTLSDASTAR